MNQGSRTKTGGIKAESHYSSQSLASCSAVSIGLCYVFKRKSSQMMS